MPLHDATWTLEEYSDLALKLSGSPFTVGVAEEEKHSPIGTSTAETCHKMAVDPEPHNSPAKPESALIMPAKPESALARPAKPESPARMATTPADATLWPGLISSVLDPPLVSVRAAGINEARRVCSRARSFPGALRVRSRARSFPGALRVRSRARSVPGALRVRSRARSVPGARRVRSRARSVPGACRVRSRARSVCSRSPQSPLRPRSPQSQMSWPAPSQEPAESAPEPAPSQELAEPTPSQELAEPAPSQELAEPAPSQEPAESAPEPAPSQEPAESAPEPAPSQEPAESAPEPAPSQELAESAPEPAPSQELAESAPEPAPSQSHLTSPLTGQSHLTSPLTLQNLKWRTQQLSCQSLVTPQRSTQCPFTSLLSRPPCPGGLLSHLPHMDLALLSTAAPPPSWIVLCVKRLETALGGGGLCHESGCHSLHLLDHTTAANHLWTASPIIHCTHTFPSTITPITAVTNHSLALIVSPHLHLIHTHTFKQHSYMHSPQSLVLAPADISERYSSCCLSLCLTPDCPTLEF